MNTSILRAIVVDDEPAARDILKTLINDHCPDVVLMAEASNVEEGVDLIENLKPDLVFLDVEMPEEDGFSLVRRFPKPDFEIIFTTAHEAYAIRALRASAIDFLLKPIHVDQLFAAIERVKTKREDQQSRLSGELLGILQQNLNSQSGISKLALPLSDGILFLNKADILYLEADRAYTKVVALDHSTLVSKPLRFFEDLLTDAYFFRPHRSYLINLKRVLRFVRKDGGYIEMKNGDTVKLAQHQRERFLKAVQQYT